jgi:uncharacterized LabA/DUF88 family protein
MRTIVYVDGYNFYYGCCRAMNHKWVNIRLVVEKLLPPPHTIDHIYFFTAAIKAEPHNPSTQQRQFLYWRALRTVPNLTIVEGKFQEKPKRLPWAEPRLLRTFKRWLCKWPTTRKHIGPILMKVWVTEEKGSDVNLASQLLMDAFDDKFDCAVVVSNDSDLLTPINVVSTRFKKTVGILIGHQHPSRTLQKSVHFLKQVREGVIKECLFSNSMTDSKGTFSKPDTW